MTPDEMLVDDAERIEAVVQRHAGRPDAKAYVTRMLRSARDLRERAAELAARSDWIR